MKKIEIQLETPYQVTSLQLSNGSGVHRIGITSTAADQVQVTLDPNICQLDAFGDMGACTKIAVAGYEAKLRLIEEREGRRLFAVEPQESDRPALRLVLGSGKERDDGRLLVLDEKEGITAVVALERRER